MINFSKFFSPPQCKNIVPSLEIKHYFSKHHTKLYSTASKSNKFIFSESKNSVLYLTLVNPNKRNVLSSQTMVELRNEISSSLEEKKTSIRAVVVQSTGPVFSSGHDLKELSIMSVTEKKNLFQECTSLCKMLKYLPIPTIACVNGIVAAAGLQFLLSFDIVLCTEISQFATSGIHYGLFCHSPGVSLVRNMNSRKKAFEMLVTGDFINAADAMQYGMVNKVVYHKSPNGKDDNKKIVPSREQLEEPLRIETDEMLKRILKNSPEVIAMGKKSFYEQVEMKEDEAFDHTVTSMVDNTEIDDCKEGFKAFLEKRKPAWSSSNNSIDDSANSRKSK